MKKIVRRLFGSAIRLLGFTALGALIIAGIVAIRHMLDTPQPLDSPLPGESHFYRWKRGHIFYKVLGASDAPPLLLLHRLGVGASAYEMREMLEPLAEHYRVYAPDLIGFGLSDRPNMEYSAETYISLCRDFLTNVVDQPSTIVASGVSCNYAVVVAATSPELCKRLVLISPVALHGNPQEQTSLDRVLPAELLEAPLLKSLLYPLLAEATHITALFRLGDQVNHFDPDYFYATTHQFGAEHATMALLAGKLVSDVSRQVEMVQQPTLIIWGALALSTSRYIGSQQDSSELPAHARIVLLQDAGLAVCEELPETVAATIHRWSAEEASDPIGRPYISEEGHEKNDRDETADGEAQMLEQPVVEPEAVSEPVVEAFCVKCKKKRAMLRPSEVTMKNGRIAVQGTCSVCGTNLFRIGRLSPA